MEKIIFFLVAWTFFAYWCYLIAKKNGRNPILAAFAGFMFGLLGVIIYAIMGKTEEVKKREIAEIIKEVVKGKNAGS